MSKSKARKNKAVPPNAVHPGEVLREDFLSPLNLSAYRLAKDLNLPLPRVNDIVREKRAITADTALRLARYFGTSPQVWMNLQTNFDLDVANAQRKEIEKVKPRAKEAAA